jgi:hypothetical protein
MTYGKLPEVVATIDIDCNEYMHYQYMPIKLAAQSHITYEKRLDQFWELFFAACYDYKQTYGYNNYYNCYVYATVKCKYQSHGCGFNRSGYHTDGFRTADINYIWSSCQSTVFNTSKFELSDDEHLSLEQMESQARPDHEVIYPDCTLLKLDRFVVHKVGNILDGKRTFVKISISKDKYNLEGNTHNYELDYNWEMYPRSSLRNVPQATK